MRGALWVVATPVLAALAVSGCDEKAPPSAPRGEAGVPREGGSVTFDGGPDAGGDDAGAGDADSVDAPIDAPVDARIVPGLDGGPPDEGGPRDGDVVLMDGDVLDVCTLFPPTRPPCTIDGDCEVGERCVSGGCGGAGYCTHAGERCTTDADCAAGDVCMMRPGGGPGVCTGTAPHECGDWRACPVGYACEPDAGGIRRCVDRRLSCPVGGGCPPGYTCTRVDDADTLFCVNTYRTACASEMECAGLCVDVIGDGTRRCWPRGECASNLECMPYTCGTSPTTGDAICAPSGPCSATAPCPPEAVCEDIHGDGLSFCQARTGSCRVDSDCPPRSLCFDGNSDGRSECAM